MSKPDALALASYLEGFYVSEDVPAVKARAIAAELRRLHAETTNQKDWLVEWRKWEEEAKRLTLENEALRKDAAWWRWLQDHALAIDTVADPDNQVQIWHGTDPARCTYGKTLSEAVDAAMKEQPNG